MENFTTRFGLRRISQHQFDCWPDWRQRLHSSCSDVRRVFRGLRDPQTNAMQRKTVLGTQRDGWLAYASFGGPRSVILAQRAEAALALRQTAAKFRSPIVKIHNVMTIVSSLDSRREKAIA